MKAPPRALLLALAWRREPELAGLNRRLPADALQQVSRGHIESARKLYEGVQARELFAAQKFANLGAMNFRAAGECFLRKAGLLAVVGQVLGKTFSYIRHGPLSLIPARDLNNS